MQVRRHWFCLYSGRSPLCGRHADRHRYYNRREATERASGRIRSGRMQRHLSGSSDERHDDTGPGDDPSTELQWHQIDVDGRPAAYTAGGDGPPVVFLHGWALSSRTYREALRRLLALPLRVYAPTLPGFGGTAPLAVTEPTIGHYAEWVDRFCDTVGITSPAVVMGHSFGGAVAIKLAHDTPSRVRGLVLVNSIGGSAWREHGSFVRSMAERPFWDWGIHLPQDLLPMRQLRSVLPVILADAVPNAIRNPKTFWQTARLVRFLDLTGELEELKARRVPVVVLWGEGDRIVTRASFDALCEALGDPSAITVPGNHSWLIADPDAFEEVITNVISLATTARPGTKELRVLGR
jgi:pimeloyl-ACP methyl ester carboxylesterase